jgi:hypothetical protein
MDLAETQVSGLLALCSGVQCSFGLEPGSLTSDLAPQRSPGCRVCALSDVMARAASRTTHIVSQYPVGHTWVPWCL